jgi:predicted HNH restriction endonuclease
MLDVHHLYPIAKGERVTTEDDLTLLCANHHRLAHTKKPEPMSVEELKKTLKAAL